MRTAGAEHMRHSEQLIRGPTVKRAQQGPCGKNSTCGGGVGERPRVL